MKDFQAQLETRPAARQLAKSVRGMPFKEAVFVINTALGFIETQLSSRAPEDVVEFSYHEYEAWRNNLDANSLLVLKQVEYGVMVNLVVQIKNDRRKGPADRRGMVW